MSKGVLIAIMAFSLALFLGCSGVSDITRTSSPATPKILKQAGLSSKWEMSQVSIEVNAGEEVPVLLKLADGDRVDGYFYLETGANIDFQITANSLIYKSVAPDATASRGLTSDRFSFTASQAQGGTYILRFRNTASGEKPTKVTIYMEVIYPATGQLFTLLDKK